MMMVAEWFNALITGDKSSREWYLVPREGKKLPYESNYPVLLDYQKFSGAFNGQDPLTFQGKMYLAVFDKNILLSHALGEMGKPFAGLIELLYFGCEYRHFLATYGSVWAPGSVWRSCESTFCPCVSFAEGRRRASIAMLGKGKGSQVFIPAGQHVLFIDEPNSTAT